MCVTNGTHTQEGLIVFLPRHTSDLAQGHLEIAVQCLAGFIAQMTFISVGFYMRQFVPAYQFSRTAMKQGAYDRVRIRVVRFADLT